MPPIRAKFLIESEFKDDPNGDIFEDFFANPWLNGVLVALFMLGCLSCIALIVISWFEKSGQAGPYRSLVNQLVSFRLDQMVVLYLATGLMVSFRSLFGPLPVAVCKAGTFLQTFAFFNLFNLTVLISGTRFAIACIYKSIPTMDDNLLSVYLMMAINIWSFLASLSKDYLEGSLVTGTSEKICTGIWTDREDGARRIPIATIVLGYTIVLHTGFTIALKLKKQQNAPSVNQYNNGHVMDLFDSAVTFITTLIVGFTVGTYVLSNRVSHPEELMKHPLAALIKLSGIPSMFCLVTTQALMHIIKNKHIRKAFRHLLCGPDQLVPIIE